ncbi:hypothetical protein [Carboxylicivirga linearis]|uniref:Extracellular endo-alpha-(1->5)-L-arabinanase C-terminal domain-containing protein n=1 Tax=Carboxylicivirga linearis TaxID=1628157 RepID=A0ABS5JRJ7_9BACT|nr:hypothetical protein [Carboxylicivirga linearis]MBS2097489.1 hypothetical protein [Carboxylicivirga linearis]
MKKSIYYLFVLIALTLTSGINAAESEVFVGKWEITIKDTPKGDAIIHVTLANEQGAWSGTMLGITEGDTEPSKFDRVEEEDGGLVMYWVTPDGYSVYLFIEEDGDDQIIGTMVDSFDVTGKRLKENKSE